MRTSRFPRNRFPRARHLALAGVLGATVAVLPAVASSETTPMVRATEETTGSGIYAETTFHWTPAQVEIAAGGAVTFANSSPTVPHGIVWSGGPATPSCEASVPVGAERSGTSWSGACSFAQPGSYTYYCSVHGPKMSGTVVVNANGTTTLTSTSSSSPPPPTTTTGATPPTPSVPASPLEGSATHALSLPKSQRGGTVRGSLDVSQAGAGGRLQVELLAARALLAKVHGRVLVGRLVRRSLTAGKVSFVVALNARARHAVIRRHRLTLMVRIVLTPVQGKSVTLTRVVVERA